MKTEINTEANGRVNLLGEHLDYNGGSVLPLQINRSIKVLLEDNNNTNEIVINSRQYKEQIIITPNFLGLILLISLLSLSLSFGSLIFCETEIFSENGTRTRYLPGMVTSAPKRGPFEEIGSLVTCTAIN